MEKKVLIRAFCVDDVQVPNRGVKRLFASFLMGKRVGPSKTKAFRKTDISQVEEKLEEVRVERQIWYIRIFLGGVA